MGCIYKITNLVNGKVYIGKTIYDCEKRFRQHLQEAKKHTHRKLYNAINKYGQENFIVETLIEADNSKLDELEQYYIDQYDSFRTGYNMTMGGDGGTNHYVDMNIVCHLWDEGKTVGQIADIIKCPAYIVSNHLRKYSNFSSEEAFKRANCKTVYQYDVFGKFIREWESTQEAERYYNGTNADNIRACTRGEQKTAYKSQWSYIKKDYMPDIHLQAWNLPIHQYSKDGQFLQEFESVSQARKYMKELGYAHPHIVEVCNHISCYKTAGGYVWRWFWDTFDAIELH